MNITIDDLVFNHTSLKQEPIEDSCSSDDEETGENDCADEDFCKEDNETNFSSNRDYRYCCKLCPIRFSRVYKLETHVRRDHKKLPPTNQCDKCSKVYYNTAGLYAHQRRVHSGLSYECETCDKKFSNPKTLESHINRDHLGKTFKCDLCPRETYSEIYLRNHYKKVHGEARFQCGECELKFRTLQNLEHHVDIHIPFDERRVKCEFCPAVIVKRCLSKHIKKHYDCLLKCQICGKIVRNLEVHNISHSDQRQFECEVCGDRFKTGTAFSRHKKIHQAESGYSCRKLMEDGDPCRRIFASASARVYHERIVHSDSPELQQCTRCDAKFRNKAHLKNHVIQVHTKEFPHVCDECGKGFLAPVSLRNHRKSHHSGDNEQKPPRGRKPRKVVQEKKTKDYSSSEDTPSSSSDTPSSSSSSDDDDDDDDFNDEAPVDSDATEIVERIEMRIEDIPKVEQMPPLEPN